ncbi:unnamed protein product [Durusdinium trenchii]|uniref:Uncharacterized protein n=2 Tax=Durusdinium trenchii TaxID=1381693 RepID=A0ABP0MKM3_9DINO
MPRSVLGDGSCTPGCAADRGLCASGVCFCKAPYSGETCEVEFKEDFMRLGYFTVMVIVSLAVGVGFFAADILWRVTRPSARAAVMGTQQERKTALPTGELYCRPDGLVDGDAVKTPLCDLLSAKALGSSEQRRVLP